LRSWARRTRRSRRTTRGLGSVQSWISEGESVEDLDIQYPETASYVESVNFAYQRYQELYPDGIQAEE